MNRQIQYKVVILGDTGVGKSTLVAKLVKNEFHENHHSTVGADYFGHSFIVDDIIVNLEIWDTAGQEKFCSVAPIYYRNANAAVIVYDVGRMESFFKAKFWINELGRRVINELVTVLVGNKIDLEKDVQSDIAKNYAEEEGIDFCEISVKTGNNVNELFEKLARKLLIANNISSKVDERKSIIKNRQSKYEKSSGCC